LEQGCFVQDLLRCSKDPEQALGVADVKSSQIEVLDLLLSNLAGQD
jgi:hypothetical protein